MNRVFQIIGKLSISNLDFLKLSVISEYASSKFDATTCQLVIYQFLSSFKQKIIILRL